MAHRSWLLAIAVLAGACSVESASTARQAIIGGDLTEPSEFPATGMIVARGRLVCTGTLIAPDVVLTAAHCLKEQPFGLSFTLDTDMADGTDPAILGDFAHLHPQFDDSVDGFVDLAVRNDIGLLLLSEPVLDVVPERIDEPEDATLVDAGNELALCGYGWRVWHTGGLAQKRDAMVVVDRSERFEFSTMAADPQPCIGDSGAPLFVNAPGGRRLVGIVSRAMGRSAMCDTGAIITRVAPYRNWIDDASQNRETGCSAGGGGSIAPLAAWLALLVRRRRRTPR